MAEGRYHWSNTALPAMFFGVPAEVSVPWLLLLLYPRISTVFLALFLTFFFIYLRMWKKMGFMDFFRKLKLKLLGRKKATTSRTTNLLS